MGCCFQLRVRAAAESAVREFAAVEEDKYSII